MWRSDYDLALFLGALWLCAVCPSTALASDAEVLARLQQEYVQAGNELHYDVAEQKARQMLSIAERLQPGQPLLLSVCLSRLADVYEAQSRHAEAGALYRRSIEVQERGLGPNQQDIAYQLHKLGDTLRAQGRYAEAEPLYRRAVALDEGKGRDYRLRLASTLGCLGNLYGDQGRREESESYLKRALLIWEDLLGAEDPGVARGLEWLAHCYSAQERYSEAEPLYLQALEIQERELGPKHPHVADTLHHLADLYRDLEDYEKAEPLYERALKIQKDSPGGADHMMANTLGCQSFFYQEVGRHAEALLLLDRAIPILERTRDGSGYLALLYLGRAQSAWELDQRSEALGDLRQSMQLVEQLRHQASGAAHQRATVFATYGSAFEQMIEWQVELNDMSEALSAMERGRARSLLDEIGLAGADLDAGRSFVEREALRREETELQQQEAVLNRKVAMVSAMSNLSDEEKRLRMSDAEAELAAVRKKLYEHYARVRSTNPVYRTLLSVGAGPPRLSQVRRRIIQEEALLLVYFLGEKGGYLLSIDHQAAELIPLHVSEAAADALGIEEAGPLTAATCNEILMGEDTAGLLVQLRQPAAETNITDALAAFCSVVLPQSTRDSLMDGKYERLIIVPDGPLALLPFETLVFDAGSTPRYMLDVAPPIHYAPSCSVLYNLSEPHGLAGAEANAEPVLTVGSPAYPGASPLPHGALAQLSSRSRYRSAGGQLTPLPYSRWETDWLVSVFTREGIQTRQLIGSAASEANIRRLAGGRKILHLACHGLADQAFGNFFGALAVTPGPGSTIDPNNDGYLTLPEIYELNLGGTELTILSACDTNYGPTQRGEGVWALSRGFLVAGSRRVVASNWLVDDEAAASVMSYFASAIAQAMEKGEQPDYAKALQQAKRWASQQEKWQSPYYWGTFVLVGPR